MLSVLDVMKGMVACGQVGQSERGPDNCLFRRAVATVHDRKDHLFDAFWVCQLLPDIPEYNDSLGQMTRLREWLGPRDDTVRTIYANLQATKTLPAELTCEWLFKPLLDFVRSSDKALCIEGTIGCGKSTLYGWIIDSLHNQIGGQDHAVLNYAIDPLLPSEMGIPSLLKGLLRQAYNHNPGLPSLHIALMSAISTAATEDYPYQMTNALWDALELAIRNASRPSIIVIDGLSELSGGDDIANKCFQRLLRGVSESPMVRLLLLSRPFVHTPDTTARRITIDSSHVHDDIRRILDKQVSTSQVEERHEITTWIMSRANGNFLWSLLTLHLWKSEQVQGFAAQVDSLPRSLDATLSLLISKIDFTDPPVRLLLLASVITVRPLSVLEAQSLLNLDMTDKSLVRHDLDIPKMVDQGCESIITINDGIIQFRHPLFKEAVRDFAKRKLGSSLHDLHVDMANRLLLYLRLVETPRTDLTLISSPSSTVEGLLRSHQLLPYALQYWTYHLIETGLSDNTLSFGPGSETMTVFPDSVSIAVLEASYWAGQRPYEALQALQVAAQTRRQILGTHRATLQSTASLAMHLRSTNRLLEAAATFATTIRSSQQILPEFHDFTVNCVSECLAVLDSVTNSDSANLPATKADLLLYMIANHSKKSGPDSDRALEFKRLLARHYAETSQEIACTGVYRDIYRFTVDRYGKLSPQAKAVARDLVTILQKSDRSGDQDQCSDMAYDDVIDVFSVTDSRRIKASITKAATFKSQNDTLNAELMYLDLLHGIIDNCQDRETDEDQRNLVRVGLLYAGLLFEQDRKEEAQGILFGLWTHFETQPGREQTVSNLLKDIATEAKRAGHPTIALGVLQSIAERSKADDVHSVDAHEVEETISHVLSELLDNIQGGSVLPKATEDALMRYSQYAEIQGASVTDSRLIHITQALVGSFSIEQRWHDVVNVASAALNLVWPAALDVSGKFPTSDDFDPALGNVGVILAMAYSMIDEERIAGYIYRNILRSARSSRISNPQFIARVAQATLDTFERLGRTDEMIGIGRENVDHYRTMLGEGDPLTLEATYSLASLCMQHGEHEIARPYYARIVDVLKKPTYYDLRAIPALKALILIFRGKRSWTQAEEVYKSLWQTFLEKGKEYSIPEETVKALYRGYSQLLEDELHVEAEVLHRVREEYRIGCASTFGDRAPVTLEASVSLAKSWQQKELDSPDAIRIYESIIDGQRSENISLQPNVSGLLEQAESALIEHYCTHLDNDMDQETLARATGLQMKQYLKEIAQSGNYSPKGLTSLGIWVYLLTKEGSLQSRKTAIQELEQAVVSVLLSDCNGKACLDAGTILASSFVECGYATEGIDAARTLRQQIIFRKANDSEQYFSKGIETIDRSKLTFIAVFEARMRGSLKGFMEIHSVTLLEAALWESFEASIQTQLPLELVLARGMKLQNLLKSHHSAYQDERLEQQMFDRFMESYSAAFTTGAQAALKFFLVLIRGLSQGPAERDLPHLACIAVKEEVKRLIDRKEFTELMEIATAGFDFIHFVGAYGNNLDIDYGFQLGLILSDPALWLSSKQAATEQALELSKSILREVLKLCRANELTFEHISIEELSKVAAVLGVQQNYSDLEVSTPLHRNVVRELILQQWLLNRLWLSRHQHGSLSQDVIVTLGRRLVDVRFFHGHIDSAIDLAEDILYNLRHVYGPSHRSAVEMMDLLSSIYMAKGDRTAAMAVLEAADLGVGNTDFNDRVDVVKFQDTSQATKSVKANIEYLLHFYQQSDHSEESVRQSETLVKELSKRLNVPTHPARDGDVRIHQPPTSWSFAVDGAGGPGGRVKGLA